jgi:hypothetical protein
MAGYHFKDEHGNGCFIDYADAYGEAMVRGTVWRWSYHEYLGPLWLKKDGSFRECQCPTNKAVWRAFDRWLREYNKLKGRK